MQGVIQLARQSSTKSEARTVKGTPAGHGIEFLPRSMFLMSSVSVGIRYQADHDKIAKLYLRSKRELDHMNSWPEISAAMLSIEKDRKMPGRLVRRAIQNLPVTIKNIETFVNVVANRLGAHGREISTAR